MSKISIYTDGACKGNPGVGGWGAVLMCGPHTKEIYGGEPNTTNNRMEVTAVIKALHALKKPCNVILHSDSKYVVDGASKWLSGWFENNWRTAKGSPIKNLDLWVELFEVSNKHSIEWAWVKGHSGNAGNDLADQLANKGILSI